MCALRVEALRSKRRWVHRVEAGQPLHLVFGDVSDDLWLWLHTRGQSSDAFLQRLLPGLPDRSLQQLYTGSTGTSTQREGWNAFRLFRDCYETHVGPLIPETTIMDFGCGWGRIIRYFLKDIEPDRLIGVDISTGVLDSCRSAMPGLRFDEVDVFPPMSFADESFNLIYAYSVFSHLSQDAHDRWLKEFSRVLAPGGLVVATTRPREFIQHLERLRTRPAVSSSGEARAFLDQRAALEAYDSGEFCFSTWGAEGPPDFGETCISEAYARAHWSTLFEVVEFIDDRHRCPQNVIVARKRVLSFVPSSPY